MRTYLVGGAVRDTYLKKPVSDQDYVVVGATPQHLLDLGFQQVGASFPVFLHPETGEEYALARTERKTGPGYHGFEPVTGSPLDPALLQKFIELGYDLNSEYPISVLIEEFQQMRQSDVGDQS